MNSPHLIYQDAISRDRLVELPFSYVSSICVLLYAVLDMMLIFLSLDVVCGTVPLVQLDLVVHF